MFEHCLIFAAEVDQKSVNTMIAYLTGIAMEGATKLAMAISSPGGSVVSGVTIYNALCAMPFEAGWHPIPPFQRPQRGSRRERTQSLFVVLAFGVGWIAVVVSIVFIFMAM